MSEHFTGHGSFLHPDNRAPTIGSSYDYRREDFFFRREQSDTMASLKWAHARSWVREWLAGVLLLVFIAAAFIAAGALVP